MADAAGMAGSVEAFERDVLQHFRQHLAGPLTGGFELVEIERQDGNTWVVIEPVLRAGIHVVLDIALDGNPLALRATIVGAGPTPITRDLVFEPFSEHGTALPIIVPADGELPAGLTVKLARTDGAALTAPLRLRHVKGTFAHLAYLGQLETARLRRTIRMLARSRLLSAASGQLLDRIGADLSVLRLDTLVVYNFDWPEVTDKREDDDAYRSRLAPYRQFVVPTRAALEQQLAAAGLADKVRLEESDAPVDAIIRIIEVNMPGADEQPAQAAPLRDAYFAALKNNVLIDPFNRIPDRIRENEANRYEWDIHDRLRARLGDSLTGPLPMTPALAEALLRILDLFAAFGLPRPFDIVQTMKQGNGNGGTDERLELAVGADLDVNKDAVAQFGAALANVPASLPGPQRRLAEIAAARVATGAPVFEALALAAGMALCLPADDQFTFVSTMRYGGILAYGPNLVTAPRQTYRVDDPFQPMRSKTLQQVAAELGIDGTVPQNAADLVADAEQLGGYGGVGFEHLAQIGVAVTDKAKLVPALRNAEALRLEGLRMPAGMTLNVTDGGEEEIGQLTRLLASLADLGVGGGALTLLNSGEILLVAGPDGVPPLGTNLSGRPRLETHWYIVPLDGASASTEARLIGRKAELVLPSLPNGLYALMAVAHRRRGAGVADPYEVVVRPAPGQTLGFEQFERLTNLLARFRPAGIEINTWRLRKAAVRFDPDYAYAPPTVRSERGIRKYRLPRMTGLPPADSKTS